MSVSKKAASLAILMLMQWSADVAFAKKDFKGLFGSYRREKFTENEGNASDWGTDIMLSTMYPVSSVASTVESGVTSSMPANIAFNVELNFYRTFGYHWMFYFNTGYVSYETRQFLTNQDTSPGAVAAGIQNLTQLTDFSVTAIPLLFGVKYRFNRTDFVPYIGAAAGISLMKRSVRYNFTDTAFDEQSRTPVTMQAYGGFEFFFSPSAGLRLELGATAWLLPQETYTTGAASIPNVVYGGTPIALRYASGVFFLF